MAYVFLRQSLKLAYFIRIDKILVLTLAEYAIRSAATNLQWPYI